MMKNSEEEKCKEDKGVVAGEDGERGVKVQSHGKKERRMK